MLQHLGGIHSGCALSGLAWLVFRLVTVFIEDTHVAVRVTGVCTAVALGVGVVSALPWIRNRYHKCVPLFTLLS